jgi:hypothetical protein
MSAEAVSISPAECDPEGSGDRTAGVHGGEDHLFDGRSWGSYAWVSGRALYRAFIRRRRWRWQGRCIKAVRQMYKEGADLIKITASGGVLSLEKDGLGAQFSDEELKAIVETAKDYGMPVAAHASWGGSNESGRSGPGLLRSNTGRLWMMRRSRCLRNMGHGMCRRSLRVSRWPIRRRSRGIFRR